MVEGAFCGWKRKCEISNCTESKKGEEESEAVRMKQKLLEARASAPGRMVTVDEVTARETTNVDAAGVLLDPLLFYKASPKLLKAHILLIMTAFHCSTTGSKPPCFPSATSWKR